MEGKIKSFLLAGELTLNLEGPKDSTKTFGIQQCSRIQTQH